MSNGRRRARRARCAPELAMLGVTIYAAGAVTIIAFDPRLPVLVPAWTVVSLPPMAYVLLALLVVRRFTILRLLAATAAACALHAVLLVATAAATPWISPLLAAPPPETSLVSSPELGVLLLVSVPLMLAPLRRFVVLRIRRQARNEMRAAAVTPYGLSARPRPATESTRPAAPPPRIPATGASSPSAAPPAPRVATPPVAPAPPPRPATPMPLPATAAPPQPSVAPAVAKPAATAPVRASQASPSPPPTERREAARAGSSTPPSAQPPAPEAVEEMVRVSFARVAEQLPADLFLLTAERLAANLLEAGYLLVPRRLVIPQLAEGHVEVAWDVVADQFPRQARAASDADIAARLDNGALSLPLDEIVRQIPPELFLLSSPSVDVRGIEDFPPPFQPHVPPPSALKLEEPELEEPEPEEPALEEPQTSVEPPPPVEEPPPLESLATQPPPEAADDSHEPALLAELARVPLPDFDARDGEEPPSVEELAVAEEPAVAEDPVPEEPAVAEAPAIAEQPVSLVEPAPPPDPAAALAVDDGPASEEAGAPLPAVAARHAARVDVRRMAALLAPLPSALAIQARARGDETLLTVVPPALDEGAVIATALRVLPFLDDEALPAVAQVTIRAARASLVITPLAAGETRIPTLVAAAAGGASLALLERLSLRAAADWRAGRDDWPAEARRTRARDEDGALRQAAVPAHVRTMATSFRALGAVTPTVLRDADGTLLVYLFLRRGMEAAPLARLARDLGRALEDAELGLVESVVFRTRDDRVLVRTVEADARCTTMLVAGGGPVDRPGLARLELDRAAARLGAL